MTGKVVYWTRRKIRLLVTETSDDTLSGLYTQTNTVYKGVPMSEVEMACEEFYPVGTEVASVLGGDFSGIVTGHEFATNRVVCQSNKTNGRVRYSYAMGELTTQCAIEVGEWYLVNGKIKTIAADRMDDYGVQLIDVETGKVIFSTRDCVVSRGHLIMQNIDTIEHVEASIM